MPRFDRMLISWGTLLTLGAACATPRSAAKVTTTANASPIPVVEDAAADRAPRPSLPAPDDSVIDLETIRLRATVAPGTGEPHIEASDARGLFEQGNAALSADRFEEARLRYESLLTAFPTSRWASAARYNLGLAHEGLGQYDVAIEQYRRVVAEQPTGGDSLLAHLRAAAVLAELERWRPAEATLRHIVARDDLDAATRVEVRARLGYVLLEQGQLAAAETELRQAVALHRRVLFSESPYFIAMAHYYLGNIAHRQFLQAPLRFPREQLQRDLDHKAALAVLAYDRYLEALAYRSAYWGTAAGYQMSHLYMELWAAVAAMPLPAELDDRERVLYAQELRNRIRPYLEKAFDGHSKNVALADAYDATTEWSRASAAYVGRIAHLLALDSRGELELPRVEPLGLQASYVPARIDL